MIVRGKGGRKIGFLGLRDDGEGMASVLLDAFAAMSTRDDDTQKTRWRVESNSIESGNPEGERGVGRDVAERNGQERMRDRVRDAGRPTASKMVAEQFAEGLREHHHQQQEQHHHQSRKKGGFNNNAAAIRKCPRSTRRRRKRLSA